jgi:hypothetical protein
MMVGADCFICRRPLPLDQAVAFMDKQQVIHVACYRPPAPHIGRLPNPMSPRARERRVATRAGRSADAGLAG